MTHKVELSIIVPVFQVEKYIRPCIESIYRQGLSEECFEVIIVNDGTKDNSLNQIQDIISQHSNITVIEQENQGLSVARNNGLALAKGEYILMPDSDDLLIENSLKPLLEKALKTKADLVVADFLEMYDEESEQLQGISNTDSSFTEKTGKALFLEDLNPYQCYVWRTLFRRQFLIDENLAFIPRLRYQDVPFTHECYLKAGKCLRTHKLLNIYRKGRLGSATAAFSKQKAMEFCIVIAKTWQLRQIADLPANIIFNLEEHVYASVTLLVYKTIYSIKSRKERNHIIDFLNINTADMRFTHGTRQKLTTLMMKKFPHLYINLYYIYAQLFFKRIIPFTKKWKR